MSNVYISSDDVSVELWRMAVAEGLVGKRIYFKSEHPDAEGDLDVRKTKQQLMVEKIMNSHLHVMECAQDGVTPDPRQVMSMQKLRHLFDCSTRTVRRAIAEAKVLLNLDESYRYNGRGGYFVHASETKRAQLARMKKGRSGRGFAPMDDSSQAPKRPLANPEFQVRIKGR